MRRQPEPSALIRLAEAEIELIRLYRRADAVQQQTVAAFARLLIELSDGDSPSASNVLPLLCPRLPRAPR